MPDKCLFIDDQFLESIHGLKRVMHRPEKKGAVIKPEKAWEYGFQTYCAPQWDDKEKKYKLWILSCAGGTHMNYLESTDGINWDRPVLRQKALDGTLENNLVTPDPNLEWPDNFMPNIVYDPDDQDESRRYKGFLGADGRESIVSPDGMRWTCTHDFKLRSSDESNLSYDRQSKTFIATLKVGGPHGRSHDIWTSKDFRIWDWISKFSADDEDQVLGRINIANRFKDDSRRKPFYNIPETYNVDVYNLGLFRYEGIYIGMPAMFHQTGKVTGAWEGFDEYEMSEESRRAYKKDGDWGGFHHIQLMCSRDLKNWERLGDRQPFIDLSPVGEGVFDLSTIMPPSSPVIKGNELWFYYTGSMGYGGAFAYNQKENDGAICLAVLRRDGFISLDAGAETGTIVTKAEKLEGTKLNMNVDAANGMLLVNLLDAEGHVAAVSKVITGDRTDASVEWDKSVFNLMAGRTVKLEFKLKNASLYSYQIVK
jgi:hypothetical protein